MKVILRNLALLLATTAAVVVVDAKDGPKNCKMMAYGYLAVKPFYSFNDGQVTYAGIVKGVNMTGLDGHKDSLLITEDAKGAALKPQEWEFAACEYPKKPSTKKKPPPNTKTLNSTYGIIRPRKSTQHSLSLTNKDIVTPGKRSSVVDSTIAQTPYQYNTWLSVRVKLQENSYGYLLYFANRTLTAELGTGKYKRVLYKNLAGNNESPDEAVQLVLLPPFVVDKKKSGEDEDKDEDDDDN